MIELVHVPASMVDRAWRDGASSLAKACELSASDITGDQLKLLLARGELTLLAGIKDGTPSAWVVVQVQQQPNVRVLFVWAIYAPGSTTVEAFGLLRDYAAHNGCSAIRGACTPAVQRLWERRFKARPIYTTMEIPV